MLGQQPRHGTNSNAMRSVLHAAMGGTVASLLLLGDGPARAQQTIRLADVAELSGSGASVGTLWRDAVHMAADELNAKGGILGQKIEITDYDTQTSPSVSRAMIQKALDDHPYAILGPIYSGSVRVDVPLTYRRRRSPSSPARPARSTAHMGSAYMARTPQPRSARELRAPASRALAQALRRPASAERVAVLCGERRRRQEQRAVALVAAPAKLGGSRGAPTCRARRRRPASPRCVAEGAARRPGHGLVSIGTEETTWPFAQRSA